MAKKKSNINPLIKREKKKALINEPKIPQQENKEISFNFQKIDIQQSFSHKELEEKKELSKYWDILIVYSGKTIKGAQTENGNKFTQYGGFPKKNQTKFKCPEGISGDVNWTRIHVSGKKCLIGYMVSNIFYIIFLDLEHKFWLSNKKHT